MKVKIGEYYYHTGNESYISLVTGFSDYGSIQVILSGDDCNTRTDSWSSSRGVKYFHSCFRSIFKSVKATDLAKKMYPNHKIEGDYIKVVDSKYLNRYNKIQEYLKRQSKINEGE